MRIFTAVRSRTRLRPANAGADQPRVERVLAVMRVALAVCALVAVWVDPSEPSRYVALADALASLYVVYSLFLLGLLSFSRHFAPRFGIVLHGTDVLWSAGLTLFTSGPSSPFFLFFLFVLLSAAYRWGLRETMATGLVTSGVLLAEGIALSMEPGVEGAFEMNRLIIRSTYPLIMSFLIGYLGEKEKEHQAAESAIARLVGGMHVERGLRANLHQILGELLAVFGSSRALLVMREVGGERVFVWGARPGGSETTLHFTELRPSEQAEYSLELPGECCYWAGDAAGRGTLLVLQPDGSLVRQAAFPLPASFLASHPARSFLGASFALSDEWSCRAFLTDPASGRPAASELRFLQALLRQVGPAAYSIYLLRRLRSRAGAVERARVARELHDSVLQSLIALELQVAVLRQQAAAAPERLAAELGPIQEQLHQEVLNVRELMQQMKPMEPPRDFLDFLAGIVQKFQRETGIVSRLVTEVEEVSLAPRVARELARIVQEALVNIRKHSGARNVVLRFGASNGHWKLFVEDDGCGFGFAGTAGEQELARAGKGPAIIKERLRSIQGGLAIASSPGGGSRLEITVPQKAYG